MPSMVGAVISAGNKIFGKTVLPYS